MVITREVSPWQEFIALLPDMERWDDLTATLNDFHRGRRVDFDRLEASFGEALGEAEVVRRNRTTLKEK
jgi:hypothetical protein